MAPLLALQLGFKLWMLVDAFQRGNGCFWYCIIMFVPFGEVAYFVTVKLPELRVGGVSRLFARRVSTETIRYRYEESPSIDNEVWLASRLHDEGEFAESQRLYERTLAKDPTYQRALYGLGLCHLHQDDPAAAASRFRKLIEIDRSYADFQVWLHHAEALRRAGSAKESIAVLERLIEVAPRLDHHLALADALREVGRTADARRTLVLALEDYRHAPRHVKRVGRASARRASRLLSGLPSSV